MNINSFTPCFMSGLLLPFGFAPFHLPGFSILALALFFSILRNKNLAKTFQFSLVFSLGFFGFGASWVYVSIHDYGHLNAFISGFATLIFILYLSCFIVLMSLLFNCMAKGQSLFRSCLIFSALWCLFEYLRSIVAGGFPWLLLGSGQVDSELRYLLPLIGIYGTSFIAALSACFLASAFIQKTNYRPWIIAFAAVLIAPSLLRPIHWTKADGNPQPVALIQANIAMRDKWDERVFWTLLTHYRDKLKQLMIKGQIIVLPESAFPIAPHYISDFLDSLNKAAKKTNSAVLFGIPVPANENETAYYNSMYGLGKAKGSYYKEHLVAFGEFTPAFFIPIYHWLHIPLDNFIPGKAVQKPMQVYKQTIASLICYEIAYPELLRQKLPEAKWIAAISDVGWFGHSLALYQQLQISQTLSILSGRYLVIANNDGLSSVINPEGKITASLPAFSEGVLETKIQSYSGKTPWVRMGDKPVLTFLLLLVLISARKRRNIQE